MDNSSVAAPVSAKTTNQKKIPEMKLNHLLAISIASSLALVACDKQTATEDKATDAKAAMDKKMDEVKETAKDKAPVLA